MTNWKCSLVICGLGLLSSAIGAGCSDDGGGLPIGSSCGTSSQCESGICGGGVCLDPEVDDDGDGLINRIEASLGTDPVVADTDGDGISDGQEVGEGGGRGVDSDGDGRIDALESAINDCDGDALPDQDDSDDGLDAKGNCNVLVASPCSVYCFAVADLVNGGDCAPSAAEGCDEACTSFESGFDGTCREAWRVLADCSGDGALICDPEQPFLSGASFSGEACQQELTTFERCAGGTCTAATPMDVNSTVSVTITQDETSYTLDVVSGRSYRVTLTPSSEADDPDLLVFDGAEARCAYWDVVDANDGDEGSAAAVAARLGKSDNGPGGVDSVDVQGPASGVLEVLLSGPEGVSTSGELSVTEVRSAAPEQ